MTTVAPSPPAWPEPARSPWNRTTRAGVPARVAALATCSIAILIVSIPYGQGAWGAACLAALAAGVACNHATPIGRRFESVAGLVLGLAAGALWLVGISIVAAVTSPPPTAVFGVGLPVAAFVTGLDWTVVERLRGVPLATGIGVLIGVASGEPWTYLAAVVWGLTAFVTLHLLEADRRATVARAAPAVPGTPPAPVPGIDLATTIVTALALAAIAALLLSVPSCRRNLSHHRAGGSNRTAPADGRSGSGSGAGSGSIHGGNGGGAGGFGSGGSGSGGSGSGSGGSGVGSDGSGGSGGRGGGTVTEGSGRTTSDHWYVPDPNGDFLIPSEDGRGTSRVPIPAEIDDNAPPGSTTGDGTTDRGADGSTRTYSHDSDGNLQADVVDRDGTHHIYRYDRHGDGTVTITEVDASGREVDRWTYDPQGKVIGGQAVSGEQAQAEAQAKAERDRKKFHWPSWKVMLGVLGAIAAIIGLAWWINRRLHRPPAPPTPPAPPWAIALTRRIEREGKRRGRSRKRDETVVAYTGALAEDELPDERIVGVGRTLSAAMFGPIEPSPAERAQAEADLDASIAAHPRPDRRERRQRTKDRSRVTTAG